MNKQEVYEFIKNKGIWHEITEHKDNELHIEISRLFASPSPRTLLFEILRPFGFLPVQLDEILRMASAISGKYIPDRQPSLNFLQYYMSRADFLTFTASCTFVVINVCTEIRNCDCL
mgnify:CR=1 FL=1